MNDSRQKIGIQNLLYWMVRPLATWKTQARVLVEDPAPNWSYFAPYLGLTVINLIILLVGFKPVLKPFSQEISIIGDALFVVMFLTLVLYSCTTVLIIGLLRVIYYDNLAYQPRYSKSYMVVRLIIVAIVIGLVVICTIGDILS